MRSGKFRFLLYGRMMQINDVISHFSPLDFSALTVLCLALIGIGWRIEHPGAQVSVSVLMAQYRREWMQQMLFRDPRIFDAQALSNLRQGTAFFASATMIALGGALALIGNAEQIQGIARDLSLDQTPTAVWEIKLLITALLLANAFLKFVWSNRLFGYCMVVMAAVPLSPTDPVSISRARKAAEINITAARSFNRGLRAIYFAMASLAFMLGPVPLMLAVGITVLILWRREFASQSRSVLLHPPEG